MLNEDYKDMLLALSGEKVRYLLMGAYALAAHGYPRATMDIDIWVMPSMISRIRAGPSQLIRKTQNKLKITLNIGAILHFLGSKTTTWTWQE